MYSYGQSGRVKHQVPGVTRHSERISGLNSFHPHHLTPGGSYSTGTETEAKRGRRVCSESHSIKAAGLNFGPSVVSLESVLSALST